MGQTCAGQKMQILLIHGYCIFVQVLLPQTVDEDMGIMRTANRV